MARKRCCAIFGGILLLLTGACTNSDVLTSQPGNATLAVRVDFTGSAKYEVGFLELREVTIHPADPQADAALGAVTMVSSTFPIDLSDPTPKDVGSVLLPEGDYRVTRMRVGTPTITDTTLPDPNVAPTTCLDAVLGRTDVHGRLPPPGIQVAQDNILDLTTQHVFHVAKEGGTATLVVNAAALVALFEGAFQQCRPARCQTNPGTICTVNTQCPLLPDVCSGTVCQGDPSIACTVDAECPARPDTCVRTAGSCGTSNTPCIGFYQPLTESHTCRSSPSSGGPIAPRRGGLVALLRCSRPAAKDGGARPPNGSVVPSCRLGTRFAGRARGFPGAQRGHRRGERRHRRDPDRLGQNSCSTYPCASIFSREGNLRVLGQSAGDDCAALRRQRNRPGGGVENRRRPVRSLDPARAAVDP
jgi:hypothetical protein